MSCNCLWKWSSALPIALYGLGCCWRLGGGGAPGEGEGEGSGSDEAEGKA